MVDLLPSDEQQQILDSVAAFLAEELPVERFRGVGGTPNDDRAKWHRFVELGWLGLGLPEAHGGVGYGLPEEALLFRACGRALVTPSLLASALGAQVAAAAGKEELCAAILRGAARMGFVNPLGPPDVALRAQRGLHLVDAREGELLLALDHTGAGVFDRTAFAGIEAVEPLDPTLPLARAVLREGVEPLAWVAADGSPLARRADILIAALLVGNAEATRDMAVAYAKLRQQFGQPIGAFQAVKHHCADMAVRCEAALSQLLFAACDEQEGAGENPLAAAQARLIAAEAALRNAAMNIQIHGGLGFTAELDAHLYLKRAHLLDQLGGPARRRLVEAARAG